jgi:hypothetical protein
MVTATSKFIALYSRGPDGIEGTPDDFIIASFPIKDGAEPKPIDTPLAGLVKEKTLRYGAVTGTIKDQAKGILPGATVVLFDKNGTRYDVLSDSDGVYLIVSIPSGIGRLEASLDGFKTVVIRGIPVLAGKTTHVDLMLPIAEMDEELEVVTTAQDILADTGTTALSTPRVREYFPETLFWTPELITDDEGSARVELPAADSVTAWKIAAVVSTVDGRMVETEIGFRTFQPFFLDFDPPPVLTEGDEIDLHVTVRNYRDNAQEVEVSFGKNDWAEVPGQTTKKVAASAEGSANVAFKIRARNSGEKLTQRITALAVSALSAWRSTHPESKELDTPIRRGLVFLLRGRNYSGIWFSTQATNRTMRAIVVSREALESFGRRHGSIEIHANGRFVKTVNVTDTMNARDPVAVDRSEFLSKGRNRISLTPTDGMQGALVFLSSSYRVPWKSNRAEKSKDLTLDVQFDRLELQAGEAAQCTVKAERVGKGNGMMLAEIGLPPAVQVDRASLEAVLHDRSSGINQYEVVPDRVVFYLWPKAGGASFEFLLSPRTAMRAKSEPSVLYDYYNPEARTVVPPFLWNVR